MADLLDMISSEKGKQIEKVLSRMKIEQIHYSKLRPSSKNFYSQKGIEELADNLIMAGMILQPLVVRRLDIGEYEVLAGHRRRLAAIYNVEQKKEKKFEFLPCIVLKIDEMGAKLIELLERAGEELSQSQRDNIEDVIVDYIILSTNATARDELTDYENMMEAMKWRHLIPLMTGNEDIKGRALRAAVAKETGRCNGTIGAYEKIYRNLIPLGMEKFKNGEIGISVAEKIAGLSKEQQEQILVLDVISIRDVEALKSKTSVSESDTDKMDSEKEVTDEVDEPVKLFWQQEDMGDIMHILFANEELDMHKRLVEIFKDQEIENPVAEAKTLFDDYLPYSNEYIDLKRDGSYEIYFNMTNEKMSVPVVPFWKEFEKAFVKQDVHSDDVEAVDNLEYSEEEIEKSEFETSDSEISEENVVEIKEETIKAAVMENEYSMEDVRNLCRDTKRKYEMLNNEAEKKDTNYLLKPRKNTKILLDALELLIAHMEGQKC